MNAGRIDHYSSGRPCLGQRVSGDATFVQERDGGLLLAIADGLGHGPAAHDVTSRIMAWLDDQTSCDVEQLLNALHLEMKGSIGAAIGLAYLDFENWRMLYAGIGNTQARIWGDNNRHFVSRPGNIGVVMRSVLMQSEQLVNGDLLLFYTDGIKEDFSLADYPTLLYDSPATVAANVIRRFGKDYDDASCIVLKFNND